MTIKAEGSTKFTFEIVASGADEAREKVEALQKALDNLKAMTKTPINLDIKLSSGAETLLKTNRNFLTQAAKAGKTIGTALKENFEKTLSTDDNKSKQNNVVNTLLDKNKESANKAIDNYVKEKEQVRDSDQKKIDEQLIWAKSRTQEIQRNYDEFAKIKSQYDNGDETVKEKLSNSARNLIGQIDTSLEERGTKLWEQLSEEKSKLLGIKEDLYSHLNEEFYKSDNFKGERPSTVNTKELLWEDDKKAVEKAKQRIIKNQEAETEIIAAENDQLFTRSEAIDKQIDQAKAIQKKISKAESSEEVKGLMSSLDGISWIPEEEQTPKSKNETRSGSTLSKELRKDSKAIDRFIADSEADLESQKRIIGSEQKWAENKLNEFQALASKFEAQKARSEDLNLSKNIRDEAGELAVDAAKNLTAYVDSFTSEDGKSKFEKFPEIKRAATDIRNSTVEFLHNQTENGSPEFTDQYGFQIMNDEYQEAIALQREEYRRQNFAEEVKFSEIEKLSKQVSTAQQVQTNLSNARTKEEVKKAIRPLQEVTAQANNQSTSFKYSSEYLDTLARYYADTVEELPAAYKADEEQAYFLEDLASFSEVDPEKNRLYNSKTKFEEAREVLKKIKNLPESQYDDFVQKLKDNNATTVPHKESNSKKILQSIQNDLSDALTAYSELSQEDIETYLKSQGEEVVKNFIADQKKYNESSKKEVAKSTVNSTPTREKYSPAKDLNETLTTSLKNLESIDEVGTKVNSSLETVGNTEARTISIEIDPPLATVIAQLNELKAGLESLPKKINIPLAIDSKTAESALNRVTKKLESNPQLVADKEFETKTTTKTTTDGKSKETTTTTTTQTKTAKDTDQLTSNSTLEELTSKLSDFKGKVTFETNLEELQSKVSDFKGKINFTSNLDDLLSKVESIIGRSILGNPSGKSGDAVLQEMVAQKTFLQESSEQFAQASKNFDTSLFASNPKQATEVTNKAKEFLGRLKSYSKDEMAALNEVFPELAENWETQAQEATKIINQSKITKNNTKKGSSRIGKKKVKSLEDQYEAASSEKIMDRALESEIEKKADVAKEMRSQITAAKQIQKEATQGEKLNTVVNNLDDKSKDISINIEVGGLEEAKSSLESLNTSLDSLKQKASEPISINVSLSEEAKTALAQQEALAKESASKAKETTASSTSKLVQGVTKQAEPTEQVVAQEVETLKTNIQTKINKALSAYSSGDLNSFYKAMSEPLTEGAKPIGDYLLDAYTQIGQIKNGDLSSIISNLSVSDAEQLKNVSQTQLNQVRSVLKDMATAYSTAYTDGLENVDETTQKAVESYQPKFNERYNQIFPSKETTSKATQSVTEVAKEVQSVKETESVLNSLQSKASELNIKLNIEPSAEQVTSQVEALKSALDSLKLEDIKLNFSTNIEEVLSQVEATRAKIQDSVKSQQTQSTTKEETAAKTSQVVSKSEEPTQVKEVKTSKEVKIPVTGEVTNLETPKEQTVKVKAVTETTPTPSDEEANKVVEKVTSTKGHVEFQSNIEELQSRLSSMRGHVEFDSNISELQAQLNMVSKGSSGSKAASSGSSSSQSTETAKVTEVPKTTETKKVTETLKASTVVEPLKNAEAKRVVEELKTTRTSKGLTELKSGESTKLLEGVKITRPIETLNEITKPIESLKSAEIVKDVASTTTALAKISTSPKALDAVQYAQAIKANTLPEVIQLPTNSPTTALAKLKDSPKALDTAQFVKTLKSSQLPEVIELSTSVPFQKNQTQSVVKNTLQPTLGMVEETFGNFREAAQTASNLTAASIQDSFKALSGQNFSRLENFTKTQAQLNNLENLLGTSSPFKSTSGTTTFKIPNELLSQVPKYISQTVPESSRYSINRSTSKLPASTSGVTDYVASRNGNYSTSKGKLSYQSLSSDLISRYNSPTSSEISKIKATLTQTPQQKMMEEVFSRLSSKSHIPSKDYLNSLNEGLKQLDSLDNYNQQFGHSFDSKQAIAAENKILETFNQNMKALDKQNALTGSSTRIASISAEKAKEQFDFNLNDTGLNWQRSVENLLTSTLKESGYNIEKLKVSSMKDGKYKASYISGENDESTTFSFKPYTDSTNKTSYAIQKTSSSVKPTTHVSSKYFEEFQKTAQARFDELQKYYGDEQNFLQSRELQQTLEGKSKALQDVVNYANRQGITQKQAESQLNRAIKERERSFKAVTKDLSTEGYLGDAGNQFLTELNNSRGKQRTKLLEDTFKSFYEGKDGTSVKNLKVLSEDNGIYTVQRESDGKKITSKIKASHYTPQNEETVRTFFTESQSNGEYQPSTLKSWGSGILGKFKSVGQYLTGMYMAQKVMSEISSGVSFIQETDKAMSNINMTMKATPQQINNLRNDAIQAGIDLKTSASNVIEAATIYANANEDAPSILAKAKPTILLANASGQSASTAADQIQAVENQFADLEGSTERIVNSYESISAGIKMDFATGIGSIADGVKNAGSIADEAGLGFEQFASIIAKVAEVTREEGSAIGNTLKTTMARISRSKTADTEVTGEDRSLAAKAYQEVLGIDLFDKNGNYADLSETLDLLASRWSSLNDVEKNYIAEQSAGVRGINTFKVMMENYGEIQKLADNALANPNYYKQVQETWANSLEGRKQEFEASKQQLWNNLLDSGTMKSLFDTGSFAVQLTSSISSGLKNVFDGVASFIVPTQAGKNGVSNLLTAGATGSLLFSSWGFLKDFSQALNGKKVGGIKDAFTSHFSPLITAGKLLKDVGKGGWGLLTSLKSARTVRENSNEPHESLYRFLGSPLRENSWTKDLMADRDRIKAYSNAIRSGADSATIEEARVALSQQTTTLGKLGSWATLNSGLILSAGGAVAVTALVNAITTGIENTAKKRQAAFDTSQEKQQKYQQATQAFGEFKSFVEENKEDYDRYTQGVNRATNQNISLSESDYQEYLKLTNQIAQYAPELISRYDSNGNAILNVKARDVEALTKALQDNERTVAQQGVDSFRDYLEAYKMANESQGMLDISDTKYGTLQERQSFLDWIRNQNVETLNPSLGSGNFGSSEYEARLGSHPELRQYLEKISSIPLSKLTEENQGTFNKDITAEYNKNESELKEIANAFRPYLSSLADLERIDHGSQYKGITEKDWDNFKAILSSTSDSKINSLLAQDTENGTGLDDFAQDWLQGLKVGGKDFAEAMDAVVTLNNRSSFKDLQFAFERYIPNLANGFPSGDQNDIINSLQLEDLQRTYQKGTEIIEKYARNEYNHPTDELQSRVKNQDILDQWRVENVLFDKEDYSDNKEFYNREFGKFIENNKKLSDNIKIKDEGTDKIVGAIDSVANGIAFSKSSFDKDNDIRSALSQGFEAFSKEASAAMQGFFDKNEINTLDELNEVERFLGQLGKEGNVDLNRLQELWDRSSISLAQNDERLLEGTVRLDDIKKELTEYLPVATANSRSINGLQKDDLALIPGLYSSLPGYDYDKLFESTYNGVHLNVEEMEKLHSEYKKFHTANYQKEIDDLTRKWQAKSREIGESVEGSVEYNQAIEDRYKLEDQIKKAQENLSRFEGMTNPVSEFLTALKTAEEGANYDTLASSSGVGVAEEMYKQGRWGTDKFKKFAQMLTKEDLAGKGVDAYLDAYEKNIANFKSLFTEDYTGVLNGLDRLKNAGLITKNSEGDETLNGTIQEVASALSLTESATVTFADKLKEYGVNLPFIEEQDHMKNLRVAAEQATKSMSDLGKSFEIDTRKTDLPEIRQELDKITKAKEKVGEAEVYPQKQADLDALNQLETYYKTLAGTVPKPLLDTRTEDGKIQAKNRLNTFNNLNEENGIAKLATQGFDWDSTNIDYFNAHIKDIGERIKELGRETGGVLKEGDVGYDDTKAILEQMIHQKQLLEEPLIMSYDTDQLKNADTKNAVEQTQNLVKSLQNLESLKEMDSLGLKIPEEDLKLANESVQSIWENIKQIDNGKLAASLAEKGGFSYDIDFNDDEAVGKLKDLLGEEHFLEIMAELVGDDQIRKDIDAIVDTTYEAKIEKVADKDGAFNRAMHEVDDTYYGSRLKDFDFGSLDRSGRENLAPSEVEVVAKFITDGASLAEITSPEEKEIILEYVRDSEKFDELPEGKQKIVLDYIRGDLPEEQIPEAKQVFNRILGIDESQEQPETLVQEIERFLASDPSETPPEKLQQLINRILESDPSEIPPDLLIQFIDRVLGQDASAIDPLTLTQSIIRAIVSDPSATPPAPVYQDVIRRITEVGGSSSLGAAAATVASLIGNAAKSSGGKADGTAHVSGTALAEGNAKPSLWQRIKDKGSAFAQGLRGKWGAKKTETALVGELNPELKVNSRTGRWELLGANGAEFAQIHKNDIIFNHRQTEELFKNGYVTSNGGRGRLVGMSAKAFGTAHVNGTVEPSGKAYGEGSYHSGPINIRIPGYNYTPPSYAQQPVQTTVNNTVNNNYYQAPATQAPAQTTQPQQTAQPATTQPAAQSAKKEAEKFLDWIEVKLDRITRKMDDLGKTAANAFRPYENRASDYVEEFQTLAEKIDLTNSAIGRYQEEAKKIGLSAEYIEKIQNGLIDIETITDEDLNDKISKYKQWWDKSLDMQYALTDLQEKLADIMKSKFELIGSEFDHIIGKIQHAVDLLEGDLGIIEGRGHFAGKSYYEDLVGKEMEKLARLQEEHDRMVAQREAYLDTGTILAGSEADLDMINAIYDVETAWKSAYKAMLDYKNDWLEMDKSAFSWVNTQVSNIAEEADFIKEILSVGENDLFVKDIGVLNEKGKTSAALSAMNFGLYMDQADHYKQKMLEINEALANDPTNTKLIDAKNEYLKLQRESILKANDEKKAIISLIKDSYQRMLDNLQKLINKRKELLNAQKNLYDYERSVRNETDNISSIQKQLLALDNDDSEEAKAKKQKLKDDLKDAKDSLYDVEYSQWLTDQENMLDYLYTTTEEFLTERLDNVDLLLQEVIDYSNLNSDMINETLLDQTDILGYTVSNELQSIWKNPDFTNILSGYYRGFKDMNANVVVSINAIYDALKAYIEDQTDLSLSNGPATKEIDDPVEVHMPAEAMINPFQTDSPPAPMSEPGSDFKVGDEFMANGAPIYAGSKGQVGQWGTHQYFSADPHYVVLKEEGDYVLARWHKASSAAGWFKKSDLTHLATGGYTGNQEGVAYLHKKERILSAQQTAAFEKLVDNYLPTIDTMIRTKEIHNLSSENPISAGNQEVAITFNLPNVTNSKDFIREMQNSKEFESLVQHLAFDPLSKKSSLRKNLVQSR